MTRLLRWSVLGVALLLTAVPALAQAPRPERPYRGLFSSGTGGAGQLLTANATVSGGYDDNVLADVLGQSGVGSADSRAGIVTSATASLAYTVETDPVSLGLSLGSTLRYYPDSDVKSVQATQGGMRLGYRPRPTMSLSLNLSAAHQPYQSSPLFPEVFEPQLGDASLPDLDLVTSVNTYLRYGGGINFSQRISRRASYSLSYTQQRADQGDLSRAFVNQSGGGGLTYNLGRGLDLHAGYRYGEVRYADASTREHHSIDAGVNYNRSLSFSRRTELSFSTGTAAIQSNDSLRFTVTGHATLKHEIGRSWNTWVSYSRRLLMNETWPEPVIADSVSAGFGGLISRRMQFSSVVRGALGKQGVERNAPGFDTAQAAATLSYALARFMNLGVTYSYYQQRFDEGAELSVGTPVSAKRHSVRATVSLWAPLFERTRRNNASR